MTVFGYARVSQEELGRTSLEGQIELLISQGGVPREHIYSEIASGVKRDRKQFDAVLSLLDEGDTLVVLNLSRFGRDFLSGIQTLSLLQERGATLKSLQEGLDGSTLMGEFGVRLLMLIADLQWKQIRERTIQGQQRAMAEGRMPGPKKKFPVGSASRNQITAWLNEGVSQREIARRMTTNRWMVKRIKEEEGL